MRKYAFLLGMVISLFAIAQEPLTLEQCYNLAEKAYPLAQQVDLLTEKSKSELAEIRKDALPQLSLNARATYQSEVIQIPLEMPGVTIAQPNKDQYQATLDVEQLIYSGNSLSKRSALKEAEIESDKQQVSVVLYALKNRVNQYFFNALLLQEQTELLGAKIRQLEARLQEVTSAVKFGTLLQAEKDVLLAELLLARQEMTVVQKNKETVLSQLSALIFTEIDATTRLKKPQIHLSSPVLSMRPELKLYELRREEIAQRQELLDIENYPRLSAFAQAGYGNPGLNMLNNSFDDFYLIGLRLKWKVFDWGSSTDKKQALEISKEIVNTEKETFLLNNNIELQQAYNEIDKYAVLLEADQEIVDLRRSIVAAGESQLQNGVITASEFLVEFNKLYSAEINQKLHELQLELAKANYRNVQGNPE